MAKKKVNVTISEELYKWCADRSEEYGMSIPSLFVMAMAQYKEQSTAMNEMPKLFEKMQELSMGNLGQLSDNEKCNKEK